MGFREDLEKGRKLSTLDNTIKEFNLKNKELILRNRKYSGKILSLNKEINSLKTTIQMMKNEKNDKIQ